MKESDLIPLKRTLRIKHPRRDVFFTAGPGPMGCGFLAALLLVIAGGSCALVFLALRTLAESAEAPWLAQQPVVPLGLIATAILATVFIWWPLSQVFYRMFRNLHWTGLVEFREHLLVAVAYHNEWSRTIDLSSDFEFVTILNADTSEPLEFRKPDGIGTRQVATPDLTQGAVVFKQGDAELVLWCYVPREGSEWRKLNGTRMKNESVPAGFVGSLQFDDALLARIQIRMQEIASDNGVIPTRPL
ncbi:MAG: hypothetical protein R3E76_00665 [Planctomycetota bacterium]